MKTISLNTLLMNILRFEENFPLTSCLFMFGGFNDFESFESSFNAGSSPTTFHAPASEMSGYDFESNDFDHADFSFLEQDDDPYFNSIFQKIIPSPQTPIQFSPKIKRPISPRIKKLNAKKPENKSSAVLMTFKPFESPLAVQKFVDAVRSIFSNEKPNFV
jgi:hypothetical protein